MDVREYRQVLERARASSAAKDWSTAAELWARITEANPYNGRGWDQLGEARLELGDFAGALEALEQVRRFGVYDGERIVTFPGVTSCLIARCHAGLGDLDAAFDALEQAMEEGFALVDEIVDDERWASLRDDSRFSEVLGLDDVAGLSRTDGWRTDLRMMRREARRRRPVPFDGTMAERFDAATDRLHDEIPELTDAQIATRMFEILTLLGDGHADLTPPDGHDLTAALPIQPYLFADGVFIVAATEEHRGLLGQELVAIDGRPVQGIVRAVEPISPRDHELRPIEPAAGWLRQTPFLHALGLTDDPAKVTVTTPSQSVELTAVADASRRQHFPSSDEMVQYHDQLGTPPLYLRDVDAAYWFEHLPEHRMVYVQFNRVADDENEPLLAFVDRLADFFESTSLERAVVDLRWNGGGNTFLVAPLLKRIAGHRPFDRPGGLFMIVGRGTFSAAGNTAKFLEWLGGESLTVVGEPAGARLQFIGETVPFTLPYSRMRCNISNLYWQGVTPLDRRSWIAPDLYAPPTFAAYRENHDPAMDAILASIEQEER